MIKVQCLNSELVVYKHSFLAASDISCFSCQLLLLSCIIVHASALQPGVVAWIKTLVIVISCILGRSRYQIFNLPVTFLSCFLHRVPGTGSFLYAPFLKKAKVFLESQGKSVRNAASLHHAMIKDIILCYIDYCKL